jgi:hypothetical protein
MAVSKKIKVLKAQYVEETDSILLLGQCEEGVFRQQIHSSVFYFGNKNKKKEMEKTAELMIGKTINMVFDPQLDNKINNNETLKY